MPASEAARLGNGAAAATSPTVRAMAAAMPRVRRRMQGAYAVLTGAARGGTVAHRDDHRRRAADRDLRGQRGHHPSQDRARGRAAAAAGAGIGASTTFSVFTGLDAMGSAHGLEVPTGDLRLAADLEPGRPKGTGPGRRPTSSTPRASRGRPARARSRAGWRPRPRSAGCGSRRRSRRVHGLARRDAPLHEQPAYGVEATRAAGPFLLAIVRRLQALGVEVDQVHPEYSPGQLEVSVGRTGPWRRPTASCSCVT